MTLPGRQTGKAGRHCPLSDGELTESGACPVAGRRPINGLGGGSGTTIDGIELPESGVGPTLGACGGRGAVPGCCPIDDASLEVSGADLADGGSVGLEGRWGSCEGIELPESGVATTLGTGRRRIVIGAREPATCSMCATRAGGFKCIGMKIKVIIRLQ
jgi:hypothetical protein